MSSAPHHRKTRIKIILSSIVTICFLFYSTDLLNHNSSACNFLEEKLPAWTDWNTDYTIETLNQKEFELCIELERMFTDTTKSSEPITMNCGTPNLAPRFHQNIQSDDKIYRFSNSSSCWQGLMGLAGYVLVRNGEIIAYFVNSWS